MTTYTLKLIGISESGSIGRQLKATITVPGASVSFGFGGSSSKHHIVGKDLPLGNSTLSKKSKSAKTKLAKGKRVLRAADSNSVVVPIIVNTMERDAKTNDGWYAGSTNLIIDMNSPVNSPPSGSVTIPIAEVGGTGKNKGKKATLTFQFRAEVKTVFDIRDIPSIMIANGWTNGAALMNKWFAAPAGVQSPGTNTIKMNWVLGYDRAKTAYDDLVSKKVFNQKAKDLIRTKYAKTIGNFGDFSLPIAAVQKENIQHLAVGMPVEIDDLACALGHFSIYAMVKGVATSKDITITHLGICVYDSYDFNKDQFLGYWDKTNNYGGYRPEIIPPLV